jgi:Ca-activated chloride channel family protein
MKGGLLVLFLLSAIITDPAKIGKINRAKEEAKKAYLAGDYETAAAKYKYLTDSLSVTEDEVLMNLGNAYFNLGDTASAIGQYQSLTQSANKNIRSVAQQQLGVVKNKQGKFEEALNHFKEAIKANPSNEDARYNYELLKKKLDEQKKQEQQNQDQNKDQQKQQEQQKQDQQKKEDKKEQENKDQKEKDQQNKDNSGKPDQQKDQEQKEQQQNEEKQDQEGEKKDIPPSSEKLEQMKISPEQAAKILEAMKNQEFQYLQQNKRKATKPKDKGKPDW